MHGSHQHSPRTTNRDPPRPTGDRGVRVASTADGARAGTEAYESLRAAVDDETDARTMTHRTVTGFDAHRVGAATDPAGVFSP